MKLHKQAPASTQDFSAAHLAEKYLGRFGQSQTPFADDGPQGRRGGRYPPSRDGQFSIQQEDEEFKEMVAKGGHKAPLTSQSAPIALESLL